MKHLLKKLDDIQSEVYWIRTYTPEDGVYDVKRALDSIVDLLGEIVREIQTQKEVDK